MSIAANPIALAWARHAAALAAWTSKHLANRRDCHGHYIAVEARTDPDLTAFTDKSGLTLDKLKRHFEGRSTGDILGLHSTHRDEQGDCWSRWLALDIDRHGDEGDPDANERAAIAWHNVAYDFGFSPILTDSNGRGGFHLLIIFDGPVSTPKALAFGKWLSRDWQDFGLDGDPEIFPKQERIKAGGYGNWIRLPGRHHTREHWSRVWDGERWLEGAEAIKAILRTKGGSADQIPAEALKVAKPKPSSKAKRRVADDLGRDAELACDALGYLGHLVDDYDGWLRIGMALTPLGNVGLDLWDHWSSSGSKYDPGCCERKWRSFDGDGVTLGTLFHEAKGSGWPGPERNGKHGNNGKPPDGLSVDGSRPEPRRPEIEIHTDRHIVVEAAVQALANDPDVYSRGDSLVTVIDEAAPTSKLTGGVEFRQTKGMPRIVPMAESVVGCCLTRNARFYTWKKDKSGEDHAVLCHPAPWLIKAVTELKSWPGIRPLIGLAGSPFIRADGSIVQTPGYDPQTGTLYRPTAEFPSVPNHPTRDEARDAAGRIFEVVRQFPFASEDDRAVWLAGFLTALARPAIGGPVPGIAIIGNKAGCGKGLLIDVVGTAVWGGDVPTTTYPEDKEEAGKVKVAVALDSMPIVHFDNIEDGRFYGNSSLDSALTSTVCQDRILGTSKTTGRIPLRPCWWLSGNNISPGKDAHRRWLPCNLVTSEENPEERNDLEIPNLRGHVAEHRGEMVRAGLTILKAHAEAGYPNDGWGPLGSFEEWDHKVRGAVWFATDRDCCVTRRKAADEAPERLDKLAMLEGWRELPGGREGESGVTVERALALVEEQPEKLETLKSFLKRIGRDGKTATPRQVGNFIRGIKGANIGGLTIRKAGESNRAALWIVAGTPTNPPFLQTANESDESNESDGPPLMRSLTSNADMITESQKIKNGGQIHSSDSSDSLAVDDDEVF